MMRTPERLTLTLPCSMFVRHLALSHLQIEGREQIVFGSCETSVREMDAYAVQMDSLFGKNNSLLREKNSLFHRVGNSVVSL